MPAALAKTIIVSLSLLTALGIAIYENPQVKEWVEEQRRKIAEALRSLGDELDPQSRQQAEAFAYEGRLPNQQESDGSANAVAVATGRDAQSDAVTRRLTMRSDQNAIDLEERKRLGRAYLARRNAELLERQRQSQSVLGEKVMLAEPTEETPEAQISEKRSFDQLVNEDGTLRLVDTRAKATEAVQDLATVIRNSTISASSRGLDAGTRFGNPFGDEFELSDTMLEDRSATPKPPVPPKIALDHEKQAAVSSIEVPALSPAVQEESVPEDLSFDEQLARALSLSLAESEAKARTLRQLQEEQDPDLEAAIEESLRASKPRRVEHDSVAEPAAPVVDFQPLATCSTAQQRSLGLDDDLYTLSPQNTAAKPQVISRPLPAPYDPVYEAAASGSQDTAQESLPTLPSAPSTIPNQIAPEGAQEGKLIDIDERTSQLTSPVSAAALTYLLNREVTIGASSATSPTPSHGSQSPDFATDSETDDFTSLPSTTERSRRESVGQSEASLIEVEDVESISSDEGDGIHTPSSWTDVGSEVGDSERSESDVSDLVRI